MLSLFIEVSSMMKMFVIVLYRLHGDDSCVILRILQVGPLSVLKA